MKNFLFGPDTKKWLLTLAVVLAVIVVIVVFVVRAS